VRRWWIALAVAVATAHPALAEEPFNGDPMAGQVLAEVWCASCHDIGTGDDVATDAAPTFDSVMNVDQRSTDFLRGWLFNPHGAMPDPNLTRSEIDDIVAYMVTLRTE
jgi:mono/diheme cytochrome c family protein